ncbi:membrane hypothetical protein [Vibrio chagasii]|nr:membrane hypothetical protein [Vibrio chagasii]
MSAARFFYLIVTLVTGCLSIPIVFNTISVSEGYLESVHLLPVLAIAFLMGAYGFLMESDGKAPFRAKVSTMSALSAAMCFERFSVDKQAGHHYLSGLTEVLTNAFTMPQGVSEVLSNATFQSNAVITVVTVFFMYCTIHAIKSFYEMIR